MPQFQKKSRNAGQFGHAAAEDNTTHFMDLAAVQFPDTPGLVVTHVSATPCFRKDKHKRKRVVWHTIDIFHRNVADSLVIRKQMHVPSEHNEQELRHLAETTIIVLSEWRRGVIDFMNFTDSLVDIDSDDSDNTGDSDFDSDDSGDGFLIDMMDVDGILGEVTKRAKPAAGHFADMMPDAVRKPHTRCHMSVQMRGEIRRRAWRSKNNKTKTKLYEKQRREEKTLASRQAKYDKDFRHDMIILKDKINILDHAHHHFGTDHLLPPGHDIPLPLSPGFVEQLHIKTFAVLKMYTTIVVTNATDGYSLEACADVAAADPGCLGAFAKSILQWEREFRKNGGIFNGTGRGFYERLLLIDEPER